jgi:hypothetical protein
MPITLRVVGIFYSTTVDLADVTPKQVMDMAHRIPSQPGDKNKASHFSYDAPPTPYQYLSVTTISATYPPDPANPLPVRSSVSSKTYPAGIYSLTEDDKQPPVFTVWQYYISDKDKKPVSEGDGIIGFADPRAKVPANGFLTWRLVTILGAQNPPNPRRTLLRAGS